MTQRRESVGTACGRVSYPVFADESTPAHAEEMNVFYKSLADAAVAYAARLNEQREGGMRFLTAEYRAEITDGRIAVEYTITLRRRGRTIARKRLTHLWEAGTLVPPPRKRFFTGIFGVLKRKRRSRRDC